MSRTDTLPAARALALLRIACGAILVIAAVRKMTFYPVAGFLPLPVTALHWQLEMPLRLASWLADHPEGILARIVRDLLLPHGPLVAALLAWGSLFTGLLLVVGARTHLAALVAMVVLAALALSAGGVGGIEARPYLLLILIAVGVLVGDAGQTLGIDGWRRERRRDRDL